MNIMPGDNNDVVVDENMEGEFYVKNGDYVTTELTLKGDGHLFRLSKEEDWKEEITIDRIEPFGSVLVYVKLEPPAGKIYTEYTRYKGE